LDAAIDALPPIPTTPNESEHQARDSVQSGATTTPALSSLDQFRMKQLMAFQRERAKQ